MRERERECFLWFALDAIRMDERANSSLMKMIKKNMKNVMTQTCRVIAKENAINDFFSKADVGLFLFPFSNSSFF